jgi:hypothetical protein
MRPNDIVVHPDGGIWFTDPVTAAFFSTRETKTTFNSKKRSIVSIRRTKRSPSSPMRSSSPMACAFHLITKALHRGYRVNALQGSAEKHQGLDVLDGRKLGKGREFSPP